MCSHNGERLVGGGALGGCGLGGSCDRDQRKS